MYLSAKLDNFRFKIRKVIQLFIVRNLLKYIIRLGLSIHKYIRFTFVYLFIQVLTLLQNTLISIKNYIFLRICTNKSFFIIDSVSGERYFTGKRGHPRFNEATHRIAYFIVRSHKSIKN